MGMGDNCDERLSGRVCCVCMLENVEGRRTIMVF